MSTRFGLDDALREVVREELRAVLGELREPREWLTVDQVAELLELDRSTVYDKIRRGVIPAHKFDGRIYVSRAELNAAIAASPSAA